MSIEDRIEAVRRSNNRLWMDILRLALNSEPVGAKKILKRINQNDKKISKLIGRLAK